MDNKQETSIKVKLEPQDGAKVITKIHQRAKHPEEDQSFLFEGQIKQEEELIIEDVQTTPKPPSNINNLRLALMNSLKKRDTIKAMIQNERRTCAYCGKTFKHKGNLEDHILSHATYSVTCEICQKEFRPRGLRKHMLKFHPAVKKELKCPTCSKTFISHQTYTQHLKNHDKKFACNFCELKFPTQTSLNSHMKFHNNPEQLKCKTCGHQSTTMASLRKHLRIHDKDRVKKYKCPRCDHRDDQMTSLKKHMKVHERNDEKLRTNRHAVECEKCHKVLKNKKVYKDHMASHQKKEEKNLKNQEQIKKIKLEKGRE